MSNLKYCKQLLPIHDMIQSGLAVVTVQMSRAAECSTQAWALPGLSLARQVLQDNMIFMLVMYYQYTLEMTSWHTVTPKCWCAGKQSLLCFRHASAMLLPMLLLTQEAIGQSSDCSIRGLQCSSWLNKLLREWIHEWLSDHQWVCEFEQVSLCVSKVTSSPQQCM